MLKNVGEVIEKVNELLNQGQLEQAERELLFALKNKMGTNEIYFLLGDIYLKKNALEKAEEAFKKILSLDSSDYLAYLNLGNLCLLNEDLKGAKKHLSLVLEKSEEYRDFAVSILGDVYFKQGKHYEAYHCFEAALKANPEDEDLLYKAGLCLTKKGLVNLAKGFLEKALQINPHNEKTKHLLASLEGEKDNSDKITIEESFIRNFKLLKQYYSAPAPTPTDENHLNEAFAENYRKNLSMLKAHYTHIYEKLTNTPGKLDLQIIPIIDEYFDLLISKNGHKTWMYGYSHPTDVCQAIASDYEKHTPVCLIGMAAGYELNSIFQLSSNPSIISWKKIPIYVVEPSIDIFKANLMIHDFSNILNSNRVFFFLGGKCLDDFYHHLETYQSLLPHGTFLVDENLVDAQEVYFKQINTIVDRRKIELESLTEQVNTYYDQITDQDWQKVYSPERNRPLRVLGVSSRFTTFLQYVMRDMLDGFEQLGCETYLLKEISDVSIKTPLLTAKTLNTFKPDLILKIDHNRAEDTACPKNIPLINWVQDELPKLFNQEAAKKIGKKDFILADVKYFKDQLIEYGYPKEKIMIQPEVANTEIYKPITLEKSDIEKYGCDVSFVHHGGKSPEQELESVLKSVGPLTKKLIETMYEIVSQRFFSGVYCYWNEYEEFLSKSIELIGYRITNDKVREELIYLFRHIIGDRFIRQIPLEIIADMGVDLKVYGRDWENHPRLSKYACGIAENGEELNNIFNASKIIIHLSPGVTAHPRVFDGMATGGFLLIQFLKYDMESVENYFEENRDFVFFRNHEDLKEKISYFLNHPEEREKIGQNAYRKVKENYTYPVCMKHLLEIIAKDPNNIQC